MDVYVQLEALYTHELNSWDTPPNVIVTDADFSSLNSTGMSGPRQSDGSLPDLNFLNLASTSDLIDVGTANTGLPYYGLAPDLGAYEYDSQPNLNKFPDIEITSPTNSSMFIAPTSITIDVEAYDTDGFISKVEFFNGSALLSLKTYGPWVYVWENVPVGEYFLTPVAYDNNDARTTSSAILVSVVLATNIEEDNSYPNINIYPKPTSGIIRIEYNEVFSEKTTLNIYDSLGKIVFNKNIENERFIKVDQGNWFLNSTNDHFVHYYTLAPITNISSL